MMPFASPPPPPPPPIPTHTHTRHYSFSLYSRDHHSTVSTAGALPDRVSVQPLSLCSEGQSCTSHTTGLLLLPEAPACIDSSIDSSSIRGGGSIITGLSSIKMPCVAVRGLLLCCCSSNSEASQCFLEYKPQGTAEGGCTHRDGGIITASALCLSL